MGEDSNSNISYYSAVSSNITMTGFELDAQDILSFIILFTLPGSGFQQLLST